MIMKLEHSLLWLEKKLFKPHRKKTYCLLLLCLIAGLISLWFDLLEGEKALALIWIVVTMSSGNKIALSCMDRTMKYLVAVKGNVKQIVVNKIILPIYRNEVFTLLFALSAFVMLIIKQTADIFFLLRVVLCVIGTPIVIFFTVTTYLIIRGFARTTIHFFTIVVFNVIFIAEQMTTLAYLGEAVFIAVLFLISEILAGKLTGETLLNKGA